MQRFWRSLFCLSLSLIFGQLFFVSSTFANSEFTKSAAVQYTVNESGETRVQYDIRIKNNMSTVYAREYVLEVNSTDVDQVIAETLENDALPFTSSQGTNTTTIRVQFPENRRVIGRDKEQAFRIRYASKDLAATYGQVLEVSIPKLADPEDFASYQVSILVPDKFGEPSLVEPTQYRYESTLGTGVISFNNVGQRTGISVLFGESQAYNLDLRYHLENTSQNVGVVQVALPPDTPYQRMVYQTITPQPEKIERDADGNWIAEFRLAGEAQAQIQVQGQAIVYAKPQTQITQDNPIKTAANANWWQRNAGENSYLAGSNFWQVQDPTIQQLSQQYSSPRAVYDYVVDTLQYNYNRFSQEDAQARLGAAASLQDPANAICQEFTDLFVTMSRATGIPARRLTGYAVTQNSRLRPLSLVADVLHAWPEYYDTQKGHWVPVDPTWADTTGGVDYFTKLDLRHIVFAIQGQNDTRPLPAGMYKLLGAEEKDIQVELADEALPLQSKLTLEKQPSLLPTFGVPAKETFVLRNTSGVAAYNVKVAYGLQGPVELLSPATVEIPVLLPYTQQELSIELSGNNWFQADQAQLTVFVTQTEASNNSDNPNNEETYEFETSARQAIDPRFRGIAVGGVLALLSLVTGGVLVFGYRRYRSLRR